MLPSQNKGINTPRQGEYMLHQYTGRREPSAHRSATRLAAVLPPVPSILPCTQMLVDVDIWVCRGSCGFSPSPWSPSSAIMVEVSIVPRRCCSRAQERRRRMTPLPSLRLFLVKASAKLNLPPSGVQPAALATSSAPGERSAQSVSSEYTLLIPQVPSTSCTAHSCPAVSST